MKNNRTFAWVLLAIITVNAVYVACYTALRATGFYQWRHIGETRSYAVDDPSLRGVYEYDLVTVTKPGWRFVGEIRPMFLPVSTLEHESLWKGHPVD